MHGPIAVAPKINVKAALWAAVIAGMVFMMLGMIMVSVFMGGSPWGPPRMIPAVGMGERVLPPPATFDADVMMAAMLIHLGLSVILAVLFAFIARGRPSGMTTLIDGAFGFVIHLISFYGMTAVFSWFAMARGWVSILRISPTALCWVGSTYRLHGERADPLMFDMSGCAKRAQRALRHPLDGGVSFHARALRLGALGIGSRRQPTQYPWCGLGTPLARCAVVLKYPATKRGGDLKQHSRQERQAKTR